jgi:hypothetical protein
MSQSILAVDSMIQNANGGDHFSSVAQNNPAVSTTGLTDEERARYEQVQAEINAMMLLEDEKEKNTSGVAEEDDDLWLPL